MIDTLFRHSKYTLSLLDHHGLWLVAFGLEWPTACEPRH